MLFDLLLDLVYLACLLFKLNMSFFHPCHHVEVVRRQRIVLRMLWDPLWWISLASCTSYIWIVAGAPVLINNLKVVRARHLIAELPDSLWRLRDKASVRLLKPVVLLCLASNWVACLLAHFGGYREALENEGAARYRTSYEQDHFDGEFSLYLMALVEAIYMLTGSLDNPVGEGSIRANKFPSLLMVAFFGPIGCVVVSLFISAVMQEQSRSRALSRRHDENKAFMAHALRILNIPKALQSRVFSLHYYQKMGHDKEAFDALFHKNNLSPALENALLVYLYRDTVCSSEYFLNKDANYIIEVLRVLEFQVFLPGDYVTRRGEIASTMYFISRGMLAILVPSQNHSEKTLVDRAKHVGTLRSGQFFGEVALVDDCVRTAWIRVESYALLSALSRENIEPIWKYFPDERRELVAQVLKIKTLDKKRVAQHRWRRALQYAREVSTAKRSNGRASLAWTTALRSLSSQDKESGAVLDQTSQHQADVHETSQLIGLPSGFIASVSAKTTRRTGTSRSRSSAGWTQEPYEDLAERMTEVLQRQSLLETLVHRALDELGSLRQLMESQEQRQVCSSVGTEVRSAEPPGLNPSLSGASSQRAIPRKGTKKVSRKERPERSGSAAQVVAAVLPREAAGAGIRQRRMHQDNSDAMNIEGSIFMAPAQMLRSGVPEEASTSNEEAEASPATLRASSVVTYGSLLEREVLHE